MAVHLLIVDALNLIRRIHAVQGSPCVEACQHALDQLIMHSQPTHAVAVFDDEARNSGWRHQRLPDYKAGRPPMPDDLHQEMPALRAAFEQRGSYSPRRCVFVIISRNAGWMRRLSKKSSAYCRNSCLITGDWPGSAVLKYRGLPVLVLKVPHNCWHSFQRWKRCMNIWMTYRRNGVRNSKNIGRWRFCAAISRGCKQTYISTETYNSYGWRGSLIS